MLRLGLKDSDGFRVLLVLTLIGFVVCILISSALYAAFTSRSRHIKQQFDTIIQLPDSELIGRNQIRPTPGNTINCGTIIERAMFGSELSYQDIAQYYEEQFQRQGWPTERETLPGGLLISAQIDSNTTADVAEAVYTHAYYLGLTQAEFDAYKAEYETVYVVAVSSTMTGACEN